MLLCQRLEVRSRSFDEPRIFAVDGVAIENVTKYLIGHIDSSRGSFRCTGLRRPSRLDRFSGLGNDADPFVEGSNVATRYGIVKTDHVLFIASGAFHLTKPSDLIPELQGRFPIRVELESLTQEDFIKILTQPENALLKQYVALLGTEGVTVAFAEDAIAAIARIAFEVNESVENIGARRLHTILTTLLDHILFDVPDVITEQSITITAELVEQKLASVARDRDLSRYIL